MLTPEQREKIARYLFGDEFKWFGYIGKSKTLKMCITKPKGDAYGPFYDVYNYDLNNLWQKDVLITKLAELVKDYNCAFVNTTNWTNKQGQILKAIAEKDTNALEALLLEVMG